MAFGEFGLDFSHPFFGPNEENRERQREVFVRQLEVAIGRDMPLVIHSREAESDTFRIMCATVPRDWKVHLHSYRGSIPHMKEMLAEFHQMYIGMPGILTMNDHHAQELVRQCPLERMLVETDAPYLPVEGHWLSHPGLIPTIMASVATLKGVEMHHVSTVLRENARTVYGF